MAHYIRVTTESTVRQKLTYGLIFVVVGFCIVMFTCSMLVEQASRSSRIQFTSARCSFLPGERKVVVEINSLRNSGTVATGNLILVVMVADRSKQWQLLGSTGIDSDGLDPGYSYKTLYRTVKIKNPPIDQPLTLEVCVSDSPSERVADRFRGLLRWISNVKSTHEPVCVPVTDEYTFKGTEWLTWWGRMPDWVMPSLLVALALGIGAVMWARWKRSKRAGSLR